MKVSIVAVIDLQVGRWGRRRRTASTPPPRPTTQRALLGTIPFGVVLLLVARSAAAGDAIKHLRHRPDMRWQRPTRRVIDSRVQPTRGIAKQVARTLRMVRRRVPTCSWLNTQHTHAHVHTRTHTRESMITSECWMVVVGAAYAGASLPTGGAACGGSIAAHSNSCSRRTCSCRGCHGAACTHRSGGRLRRRRSTRR